MEVKGEEARNWVSKRTYGPAAVDSREKEKRKMYDISYTSISHSSGVKGKELSIRAKALSVEIAVTDDIFLYVAGDCRWVVIRPNGCFGNSQRLKRDFFFLFSVVVIGYVTLSARGSRGMYVRVHIKPVKDFPALEKVSHNLCTR